MNIFMIGKALPELVENIIGFLSVTAIGTIRFGYLYEGNEIFRYLGRHKWGNATIKVRNNARAGVWKKGEILRNLCVFTEK